MVGGVSQAASAKRAGQINARGSPAMAPSVSWRRKASGSCLRSSAVRNRDSSACVSFGTDFGAVLLADLAGEYGLAHLRLATVLRGRQVIMIEEGQQCPAEVGQAVDQARGIGILEPGGDQCVEALVQASFAALVDVRFQFGAAYLEPDRILEQALDAASGFAPGDRGIALIDPAEFGEQVERAALFGPGLDRVIGGVEVADQPAFEELAEDGIHHLGITPAFDPEVGQVFGAEGLEPVGGTPECPTRRRTSADA